MANIKINELPEKVTTSEDDLIMVGDPISGELFKLTANKLNTYAVKNPYIFDILADNIFPVGKDGVIAFENRGKFYLVAGWNPGRDPETDNEQYVSEDSGYTWEKIENAPFTGRHTVASETLLNGKTYIVGGDLYNIEYDGGYSKQSWSFDDGEWTKISEDCGIGNRVLSELVHHSGSFYIVGGQATSSPSGGLYNTVLRSDDNCASFTEIGTTPFQGGNFWGAVVSFKGKIWKICGGVYSDVLYQRTYPREIWSSVNGIDWVMEGMFPGIGRQYHQLTVIGNPDTGEDEVLILTHGANTTTPSPHNLSDVWISLDGFNWSEIITTDQSRHAHSAFSFGRDLFWSSGSSNGERTILYDFVKLNIAENLQDYIINAGMPKSSNDFANTIVQRDERGYVDARIFRSTEKLVSNSVPPLNLTGKISSEDDYLYQFTPEMVKLAIGDTTPNIEKVLETGNLTSRSPLTGGYEISFPDTYEAGKTKIWFNNEYGLNIMPGVQMQPQERYEDGELVFDSEGNPVRQTGTLPTRLMNSVFLRPDGGVLWENKASKDRTDFTQIGLIDLNTAPSSSSAAGDKGEVRITTDYIYVCVATNTWKRTALTTW